MIYAKLVCNFSKLYRAMYYIHIDNQTIHSISDKNIAYANYRALCRDYANKSSNIKLLHDDQIIHAKAADLLLLDELDNTSANDVLFAVMSAANIDKKQLRGILSKTDLQVSKSRIDGWCRTSSDRKFVRLHNDELAVILAAITAYLMTLQYSPQNIQRMRADLGMTQAEIGEALGVGDRQVRNWEAGKSGMRAEQWMNFQKIWKESLH